MAKPKKAKTTTDEKPVEKTPETKEQKLLRLANARVTKACKYISLVGNLAAYKPTPAQSERILEALNASCETVAARLAGTRSESITFRLT